MIEMCRLKNVIFIQIRLVKFCAVKKNYNLWFLILLTVLEILKVVLANMVTISMMLAKLATLQ